MEPWEEAGQRVLMRLLALSSHRSEALAQFEKCRQVLSDELGVEPSADTRELYKSIHSGEFVKSIEPSTEGIEEVGLRLSSFLSAAIVNLPSVPTPFIGREDELASSARAALARPAWLWKLEKVHLMMEKQFLNMGWSLLNWLP